MPPIELPGSLGRIDVPADWRRPCRRSHWGDGVRTVATPPVPAAGGHAAWRYGEVPSAVVSDGSGGAFVLATRSEFWPLSQGAFSLAHVAAQGAAGARIDLADPLYWAGVIGVWADGAMCASGPGRVIVATADPYTRLGARRFNASGRLLWRSPRQLCQSVPPNSSVLVLNLVAEPSKGEAAIFAWRHPLTAGACEARVQRIGANGRVRWGADGVSLGAIAGAEWPAGQPWIQLVAKGDGGAIVVYSRSAARSLRLFAVSIAPDGTAGSPVNVVSSTSDDLSALQRVRVAVTDGSDGMLLAYPDTTGALHILRYTPGPGVRWDIALATPTDARAYWINEDGRGGALVAWLEGAGPRLQLKRIDAQGATTFDAASSTGVSPIDITLPPGATAWGRDAWARLVKPLPDGGGGSIVAFQSWTAGSSAPRVHSCCFDGRGALVSGPFAITARASGQSLPFAAAVAPGSAAIAWADDGAVQVEGLDVWTQRVGCCPPLQLLPPPPPFGCEILPLPGMGPGEIALQLPCGNRTIPFGVIPLSRLLDAVPGVSVPPALVQRGGDAPDWFRLLLFDVPDGLHARVCTLGGRTVADAKRLHERRAFALTFKPPSGDDDLLVVFSHARPCPQDTSWKVRLATAYGTGRAPALPKPAGATPRRAKPGTRRSAR